MTPLRDCNLCNEVCQLLAPPSLVATGAALSLSIDLHQKPLQKPLEVTFAERDLLLSHINASRGAQMTADLSLNPLDSVCSEDPFSSYTVPYSAARVSGTYTKGSSS